jgi:polyhydroxybutyrate depolymerase
VHRSTSFLAAAVCSLVLLAGCAGSDDGASSTSTSAPVGPTASSTTSTTAVPELPADRPIDVVVPAGLDASEPAPLVVLLHGYGASGEVQAAYLRLLPAAEERGMLVVAPDGTENRAGKRFWNATDACCAGPLAADVDDSAYLADVIASVRADHEVDPARIYVMGHSNGGFMSFRMACDHADVVAAVASLEGSTFEDPDACSPSEPVSVLAVHGTADETIPYEGDDIGGTPYPSAEQTVATWADYNACEGEDPDPTPAELPVVADLEPATVTQFEGCADDTSVELWTQPDGVHIPRWDDAFIGEVLDWLLAHPKG